MKRRKYRKLLEDPGTPPETKLLAELLLDIRDLLRKVLRAIEERG